MEHRRLSIGYIGGGSRNWAMKLMTDLALEAGLEGELRLYDLDPSASKHNETLGRAIFSRPDAAGRFEVRAVGQAVEALRGADFVVMSIEPGPMEARVGDLVVPARHGILQTVGDTTGPGGLLRALRAVPVMMDYGRLIMETCPEAWVINYTNPMTLCTAALHAGGPGIRAHGCCHEVFSTLSRIADIVAAAEGVAKPSRHEIELEFAGVNHFTLATGAKWRGRDVMPLIAAQAAAMDPERDRSAAALERRSKELWFDCDGAVAYDFLRRFGVLGSAGDRHLAEFVPWYLAEESSILAKGVPPTPYEWRVKSWAVPRPTVAEISAKALEPSGEEGVAQMKALLGLGAITTNLNLPNRGQWPQAPRGAVVETNALLDLGRVEPLIAPDLPPAAAALESRVIAEQALVLEAARTRDKALALEALLLDPLVHLSPAKAEAMLDEMLKADAPWLPGWSVA
jgi:galacturan 1,4-alpha-galacturonidase